MADAINIEDQGPSFGGPVFGETWVLCERCYVKLYSDTRNWLEDENGYRLDQCPSLAECRTRDAHQ